jgi:hypothetical protein
MEMVASVADLEQAIRQAGKQPVVLLVNRLRSNDGERQQRRAT